MSSMAKSVGKRIKTSKLTFPVEMYNTLIGSLVVCAYIFTDDKTKFCNETRKDRDGKYVPLTKSQQIKWVSKRFKKAMLNPSITGIDFEGDKWIDQTMAYFRLTKPSQMPIAFVQSDYNVLFAPYVNGQILPLREDGYTGVTLRTGSIYPITESGKIEVD